MRFNLCNEVLRDLDFAEQCRLAQGLGYKGIELAPFTLNDEPHLMSAERRREVRSIAEDAGVPIMGLHWLMITPEGLSITSSDPELSVKTRDVLLRLVDLCADLGGKVLVHGSPAQRDPSHARDFETARSNALEHLRAAGDAASSAGVTYCIEPLAPAMTSLVNTVADGLEFVADAGSPGLKTMIDTCAARSAETEPVADVIRKYGASEHFAHVHLNDSNRRAPGQGADKFRPILRALQDVGYGGEISIEPFVYQPDGPTTAAYAAAYLQGVCEGLCHD